MRAHVDCVVNSRDLAIHRTNSALVQAFRRSSSRVLDLDMPSSDIYAHFLPLDASPVPDSCPTLRDTSALTRLDNNSFYAVFNQPSLSLFGRRLMRLAVDYTD